MSLAEPLDQVNRAPGRVVAMSYLGATQQLIVRTDAIGPVTVAGFAWSMGEGLPPGTAVWISWPPDATTALEDDIQDAPRQE